MIGFIKKDLSLIKNNSKTLIVILFAYICMSFNKSFDMAFILPFFAVMIFISTFSYDDYNNWNAYAVTLPNGRKNVVRGKYIASIILVIISSLLCLLITLIASKMSGGMNIDETLSSLAGCVIGIIVIISFMFPLIFKFGSEKGRIYLFILVFGIALVGTLISKAIDLNSLINNLDKLGNLLFVIIPLICIIVLIISYFISSKIYLNKEF